MPFPNDTDDVLHYKRQDHYVTEDQTVTLLNGAQLNLVGNILVNGVAPGGASLASYGIGPQVAEDCLNPNNGYVNIPDASDLIVNGDVRWTCKVRLPVDMSSSTNQSIAGHRSSGSTNFAWHWAVVSNQIRLRISEDGSTILGNSLGDISIYANKDVYLRVDFFIGTHQVNGYISTDGVNWNILPFPQIIGTPGAPLFDCTAPMTIGQRTSPSSIADVFTGYIYWVQMEDVIGEVPSGIRWKWSAAENPRSLDSFTDPRGKVWTTNSVFETLQSVGTYLGETYINLQTGTTWRWNGIKWDKLSDVINVLDYGANGQTYPFDNLVPIQRALNAAETSVNIQNINLIGAIPTNRAGTVFIPKGTYEVSDTLIQGTGVILEGDGVFTTTVRLKGGANKDVIRNRHFNPSINFVQEPGGPDSKLGWNKLHIDGGWRYNEEAIVTSGSTTISVINGYRRTGGGFFPKDVGSPIKVFGAGPAGADLMSTILTVDSVSSITIADIPSTSVPVGRLEWGNLSNNTGIHVYAKAIIWGDVAVTNCATDNVCTEDVPGGGQNDWVDMPEGSTGGYLWLANAGRNNLRALGNHDNMWPDIGASRARASNIYIENAGYEFGKVHAYSAGVGFPVFHITTSGKIRADLIIAETTTFAPCMKIEGHLNQISKLYAYNMRDGNPGQYNIEVAGDNNQIGLCRSEIDNIDFSGILDTGDGNVYDQVSIRLASDLGFVNTVQCFGMELRGRYTRVGHIQGTVGSGANSALVGHGRDPVAGRSQGITVNFESHLNQIAYFRTRASSADYLQNRITGIGSYDDSIGQLFFAASDGVGGIVSTSNFRTDGVEYYDLRATDPTDSGIKFVLSANQMSNGASAWNGNHIILGVYHLWVDSTGDLRIKNGAPSSDTDGTVVGTQT